MKVFPKFYLFGVTFVVWIAVFLTRSFPFLFGKVLKDNKRINFVGDFLPPTIMLLLFFYSLRNISFDQSPHGIPDIFGIAATTLLHLWKKNAFFSIVGGTVAYMILLKLSH